MVSSRDFATFGGRGARAVWLPPSTSSTEDCGKSGHGQRSPRCSRARFAMSFVVSTRQSGGARGGRKQPRVEGIDAGLLAEKEPRASSPQYDSLWIGDGLTP